MADKGDSSAIVFFIDRCLGGGEVADSLKADGFFVEVHDSHFARDCRDQDWIPVVSQRGWVILSKDPRMMRRCVAWDILVQANAAVFYLLSARMPASEMVETFHSAMPRMLSLLRTHTRPLICTVSPAGKVEVREGQRRGGVRR